MFAVEGNKEFYYLSKYPVRLCRDYMKHFNIYDRFLYTWEEREGYYLMTFTEHTRPGYTLVGRRKPVFRVTFEDFGDQTGIRVQYLNLVCWAEIWVTPCISLWDIDKFWEKKLDAKRVKLR